MRLALIVLVLAAVPLWGATAQDYIDCENAVAQQHMNACARMDFDAADKELNEVWKKARATARTLDAEQPKELKGAELALLAAQRGWIAYRDGSCEVAGFEARGGSMEPMLVSGCLAELTRARTEELRDFVGEEEP